MTPVDGAGPGDPADAPRGGRSYLSIGEVLDALKEHFPDVTISKIRFFEAQGLLVPERTPSGYRKFYAADLERLRIILAEQQERYVPLTAARSTAQARPELREPTGLGSVRSGPPDEFFSSDDDGDDVEGTDHEPGSIYDGVDLGADRHPAQRVSGARSATPGTGPARSEAVHPTARRSTVAPLRRVPPIVRDEPQPERAIDRAAGHRRTVHVPQEVDDSSAEVDFAVVYSLDELMATTGATSALVDDAMRQGFVHGRSVFGETEFDDGERRVLESLVIFASHGIDPRHVRVFLHAAQREADLYVQATLPLLRRRPRAGVDAEDPFRRFGDLERAGATLRTVVVRRALQQATEGVPGPVGR